MSISPDDDDMEVKQRYNDRESDFPTMVAAIVLVLMMAVGAFFNILTLRQRAEQDTKKNLAKLALVISEETSRSFQSVDLTLRAILERIAEKNYATPAQLRNAMADQTVYDSLSEKASGLPQISNIAIFDADGVLVNNSLLWPAPLISIDDREQFRYLSEVDDTNSIIGEPVLSRIDGSWKLFLARRINGPDRRFLGLIEASIKLKSLEDFYQSIDLGEGSTIALIRRDGALLARYPRTDTMIGRRLTDPEPGKMERDLKEGAVVSRLALDGEHRYVAYRPVKDFPLTVSTTLTQDVVLASWRGDATIEAFGALGAVAGVLLLLSVLTRQIGKGRRSALLLARQNARFARSRQMLLDAQRIGKLGHWMTNAAGDSAVWSPQLFEIAGLAPRPGVSLDQFLALIHPEDLQVFLHELELSRSGDTKLIHELRWVRPDGAIRWIRMEADRRRDANGDPVGVFGIVQDITERKRAEAAAEASRHLLVDAIESMSQGFVLYDKHDRFVLANSHFKEMFPELADRMKPGMRYEDVLCAVHQSDLVDAPKAGASFDEWLARTTAWHRAANRPIERRYDNGRWIRLVDHRTSDGGIAGLRTDITDFKTIEAALEQKVADLELARNNLESQKQELVAKSADLELAKETAEAASRAKSDFLAIMSHEIRTPMSGMVGMIDLLRETPLTAEQKGYAEIAKESVNSLLGVTNDILDFSKLEAGELKAEAIDFDIEHTIGGAISLMKAKAQAKQLDIRTVLTPGLPKWLVGDPSRIRQILLNLINNAIKFTEQGAISVKASYHSLDDDKIELRIEIVDTGIGIPMEVQQRLFNPFVQADTSISRKYGGTGLGLAICKQLALMMGGEIGVRSGPEPGSTFWFTVHCGICAAATIANKQVDPVLAGDLFLEILVAEDSPIIASLISTLLGKRSYTADVVGNGHLAVAAVQAKRYDLVLMDVQMPEMDGISATRAIRALPGTERNIPIIALTANAFVGQRESYLAAGMDDCVTKPIQPNDLFAAISRCGRKGLRVIADQAPLVPESAEPATESISR
uniref:Sensory/regulatory protein RpfC n=1 Tax=Rhodopseudomonas palustris (strain BisA53) TaxID=316055 RepID=Q07SC8_RHOP5